MPDELSRLQQQLRQRTQTPAPTASGADSLRSMQEQLAARQPAQQPATVEPATVEAGTLGAAPGSAEDPLSQVPIFVNEADLRESLSVGSRMWQRLMGTDVSDPLEYERLISQLAGAVGGGMLGSRVPPRNLVVNPITGSAVMSVVGSLGGAAAPEAVARALESAGVFPQGFAERHTLSNEELRTVLEGEALLEMATGGTLGLFRLGSRATAQIATGMTREGRELAERSAQLGVNLMPVQIGERAVGRGYMMSLGAFPIIGGPFRKVGAQAEADFLRRLNEMPDLVAPLLARSDLGEQIYRDANNTVREINDHFRTEYGQLRRMADASGIRIIPRHTLHEADAILREIESLRGAGPEGASEAMQTTVDGVRDFLQRNVLSRAETTDTGRVLYTQSWGQFDQLQDLTWQYFKGLEPQDARYAEGLITRLQQAMKRDATTNIRGPNAQEFSQRWQELDAEFASTMSQVLETAAAKRFGSVQRGGLRSARLDSATRMPVDELARTVIRTDSPQIVDELSRLVTPETFQQITRSVLDDSLERSVRANPDGSYFFNTHAFEEGLGLIAGTTSPRAQTVERLLRDSSGLEMEDLRQLVEAGRAMTSVPIPNANQFVQRRGVLGGRDALINSLTAGATAGAASRGGVKSGILGSLMFLGGARAVSSVLANPLSARSLKNVMAEEAAGAVTRGAYLRALRTMVSAIENDGGELAPNAYEMGKYFLLGFMRGSDGDDPQVAERDVVRDALGSVERRTSSARMEGVAPRGRGADDVRP